MIHIGTSGYQYPEWRGTFYPETLSTAKMLRYYAEVFSTTEVNYTFRHIPSAKTLQRWRVETPDHFKFSLKAPQRITHFAKLRDCEETLRYFCETVLALEAKLGVILFQLPPTFKKDEALLRAFLKAIPTTVRAAFEFRHASWFEDSIFAALRESNAALCIAESEDLGAPEVSTADFGYYRLRRENYTEDELARWAKTVASAGCGEKFVYFKHEESGVGPKFARQFAGSL